MAALVIRKMNNQRGVFFVMMTGAVLFRLTLLPAGLPHDAGWKEMIAGLRADVRGDAVAYERFQLYDDDLWRYLWDGHVQAQGINPYLYAPTNEKLNELAGQSEVWSAIRDNINYADTPTIYPPLAQMIFRLSHAIAPGSVLVMKSLITLCDLLAVLLLALALRASGQRVSLVLLYAWNPLVVKVFAGSGHIDAALVAAIAAMAYFIVRRAPLLTAAAFALAILAKLSPVVLLPFVMKRIGWRYAILTGAIVISGYLPFIGAGATMFDGFRQFAREWQFNAGPFALAQWLAGLFVADSAVLARAVCGLIVIALIVWLVKADDGRCESFARYAALSLGALLLLSPAVMPWYVTWLLPLAVLAGQRIWIYFSVLVCAAFLVMVDETERAWALWLEYGTLALLGIIEFRRTLKMKHVFGSLLFLMLLSTAAFAQGSGSSGGIASARAERPFAVTKTVMGKITEVKASGMLVIIEDSRGKKYEVKIDRKTKFSADAKSEAGGKKDLGFDDLQTGQMVKVVFRESDKTATMLQLRAAKA
ncbi:MAG: glycosyltransferase 87 family protein [Blastocatellia bacterium]